MEWIRTHLLRQCRKLTDMVPIAYVLAFAIITVGTLGWSAAIKAVPFLYSGEEEGLPGFEMMLWQYLGFTGIWVAMLFALALPPANRRIFRDILPNGRGNSLMGILLGILGGFATNAICILISWLKHDIGLSLANFEALKLLMLYGAVFVQSGAEEIICRQYLYEKFRRRYQSPLAAIIFSAAFFGALHIFNPGITPLAMTQIVLVAIIFTLMVYYFDALWAAMFFHTTWNFTQNFFFGCPNSGIVSAYSLFKLDAAATGPFFDPVFGVEGSIGASAILAVLLVAMIVYAKTRGLEGQDLWADLDAPRMAEQSAGTSGGGGKHFA